MHGLTDAFSLHQDNQTSRRDLMSRRGANRTPHTSQHGSQVPPSGTEKSGPVIEEAAHETHQTEGAGGDVQDKTAGSDDWPSGEEEPEIRSQAVTAREESDKEEEDSSSNEDEDIKPVTVRVPPLNELITKENIEGVLASSDPALIGKEINMMTATLRAIRQSVRHKEKKLNAAINAKHPEVTIIERPMSPLNLPSMNQHQEARQIMDVPPEERTIDGGHVQQAQVEAPAAADRLGCNLTEDTNPPDDMPRADPADDTTCVGATSAEDAGPDKRSKGLKSVSTTKTSTAKRIPPASKIKSNEFVDDADMPQASNKTTIATGSHLAEGTSTTPVESNQAGNSKSSNPPLNVAQASASAPTLDNPKATNAPEEIVVATDKQKGKDQKSASGEKQPLQLTVNKNHEFHKAKLYLGNLLMDKNNEETQRILQFEDQLTTGAIKWGETLSYLVRTILHEWSYDESTEAGKANPDDLHKFVMLMKDMSDDDKMITRFKCSPCLMQIHKHDPIWRPENVNWRLIQAATEYPWKHRNAILRAIHQMTCRTDDTEKWATNMELAKDLQGGFRGLLTCLQESLDHITLDTDHNEITIRTEGEDSVHEEFVELSKCMAWLFRGAMVSDRPEVEGKKQSSCNPHRGLAWFKRKFFLVLVGVLMVYEAEQQDLRLEQAEESRKSQAAIKALKAKLKDNSCIKQLVRDQLKVKKLAIKGAEQGLLHVWPGSHDQSMHEGALLINFTSLLVGRRRSKVDAEEIDEAWGYGSRAWNHMDNHMFKILKLVMTRDRVFRSEVHWPTMTDTFRTEFNSTKLAHILTLDIQCEICLPGLSRSLTGKVAPPVKDKDKAQQLLRPSQVHFQKMFGPTEGDLHPVRNRGQGLHPEKQVSNENPSTSTFTPQANAVSQRTKNQATATANAVPKRPVESGGPVAKKRRKLVNATSEKGGAITGSQPQGTQDDA
ncbi:uncharacterized protein MELLADRAFT_114610 [Melampsora larici-populina 98AG31]|uniref:Uncharacterized protein n=1 Tax=Melampsora larici-populina (strain 98AG31 / pathotype 3-4-7) TaxID=747676 RepID=F4SE46_MELLP|nr:uncharacterized protein MELLADRAFT_114610 [Melampsora larici-populina 98AG31]EGF97079.1 hypothetical protein MELLADRAFT_114610 [Melampsora larici-populina 98AG31]